ncbi:MAG: pilus (MSHA type) biogenesis protein MshL [Epsilonproteobacteria bacterium]|nr:pilus (MSHA type) biogenesis protein MshL [Campylobacterota bacterium]NPA56529.1 pilus (MSHA type) biogenesis protein MshL [Campylobacterota bacterium]
MRKVLLFLLLTTALLYGKSCDTQLFTLKSAPGLKVKEFIDNIAQECHLSVVVKDKYAKRALEKRLGRINLEKVSLYEILNLILEENDLSYTIENGVLKISYLVTRTFHVDYVISKRTGEATTDASVDVGGVSTNGSQTKETRDVNQITSKEEFDFWKNLQEEIYHILNRPEDSYKAPKPIVNEKAGLITVTATKEQVERVRKYINMIEDRLHKEVLIDVSILAVFLNDRYTAGIDWSRFSLTLNGNTDASGTFVPTNPIAQYTDVAVGSNFKNLSHASTATTIINAAFNLSGLIEFLRQNGKVVTLSNPKILTLNNQPAIITIGDTLNYNVPTSITISANSNGLGQKSYTPSSIFVGILLNITPEITQDDHIILRINPSISELRNPEEADISKGSFREIAPDTKEKKISTVVKVKDGATLILGGLISNTRNFMVNGVPLLKDIPILGALFKSKKKNHQRFELIFVIRPKVIKESSMENIGLKDLGFTELGSYGQPR